MAENENRFIPNSFQVPNSIVDEFLLHLSEYELKCYLFIIRKTKGWQKEADSIAISQFIKTFGNKDARTIKKALKALIQKDLIQKEEKPGKPSIFSINLVPNSVHADEEGHPDAPPTFLCNDSLRADVPTPPTSVCTPQKTIKNTNTKNTLSRKEEKILNFNEFKKQYLKNPDGYEIEKIADYLSGTLVLQDGYLHNSVNKKDLSRNEAIDVWHQLYNLYKKQKQGGQNGLK
jgi:phage replication O-like protein O